MSKHARKLREHRRAGADVDMLSESHDCAQDLPDSRLNRSDVLCEHIIRKKVSRCEMSRPAKKFVAPLVRT